MKFRFSTLLPILLCIILFTMPYTSVIAAPPLPARFYGTVTLNGENVLEGTIIRALINGRVVATSYAMLVQGKSVYAIDVPGDDPATPETEGGNEGDMIRFMLAGFLIKETATWQSGTDIEFNLSLTANATLPPPQPTETPTATQTPLPMPTQTDNTQPTQTPVIGPTQYPIVQPTQTDITGPTQYPITQPTQPDITQPTQAPTTGQTPVLTATLPSMPTASELPSETSEAFVPIEATETLQPTRPEIDQPTIANVPETITETDQESRGLGFVIPSIIFVSMVAIGAIIFWLIRKNRNEDSGLLL